MKKRITRPDGTIEEVEGTAEELAELERSAKKTSKKESKMPSRRILTDEIQRLKSENEVLKKDLEQATSFKIMLEKLKETEKQPEYVPFYPNPRDTYPWRDAQPYQPLSPYWWQHKTICSDNLRFTTTDSTSKLS